MKLVPTRFGRRLLALVAFALAVRLFGLNFDQSHYFHPDERRIAEAVTQLSLRPLQLNPHFFAYGSFPLYVTKLVTATLSNFHAWFSSYDAAILVGRALSALWGTATVLLLVLLGRRLFGGRLLGRSWLGRRFMSRWLLDQLPMGFSPPLQEGQNLGGTLVYGGLFRGNIKKRKQALQSSGIGPILKVDAFGLALLAPVLGGVGHGNA
jgi:hypothetical protein